MSGFTDMEYLAFARVKLHVPGSFLNLCLEYVTITVISDSEVDSCVICKESYLGLDVMG